MGKKLNRIRRWNVWRKRNKNSKFHKLIVLLGIIESPTMMCTFLPEEQRMIQEGFEEGIRRGGLDPIVWKIVDRERYR